MIEVYNQDVLPDISLPTRCTTCNKVIGNMEFKWLQAMKEIDPQTKNRNRIIMDKIGIVRQCCAKDVLAHMKYVLKDKL